MSSITKPESGKIKPTVFSGLLDPFFKRELSDWMGKDFIETIPNVNISETPVAYHVEMAAPGLKKEDFTIKVDGDIVTISCSRQSEQTSEGKEFTRREYNYSSFSRSFTVPQQVNQDKISATYADGVLKVDFPKMEPKTNTDTKKILVS
jgi:HSP20 family protein